MKIKLKPMIRLNVVIPLTLILVPMMVWGLVSCGSKNVPVAPSGTMGLNISMQASGLAKSTLLGAATNEVYYSITGPAMSPVTGVSGPITTAASSGTINLSLAIPAGSARLMAFQINDASTHQPLALGAVQTDVSSQPSSQVVVEMGSLVRNCYNLNTSSYADGSYFNIGNGVLADAITVASPTSYDIDFLPVGGQFQLNTLNANTVAYLGNGNLVNFAMAPTTGYVTSSGAAKLAAGAATNQLQAGDVFCIFIPSPNAHIWLQVTNVGSGTAGPSFIFRGNTTLPYYAYQQTPADLAGPCATPIPTPMVNYSYKTQWGTTGNAQGQFNSIWAIALDPSANVYATDQTNTINNIQVFSNNGTFITSWAVTGSPQGIAVDTAGNVYIAEFNNSYVEKYTSSGTFISQLGTPGTGNGQFTNPRGIAVDASGNVYVTDGGNSRVEVFNSAGAFTTQWGTSGTGNGQFTIPWAITVDKYGNVYVTDPNNYRVEVFNPNGVYVGQWGTGGAGNGQFNQLAGLTTDLAGNVYVADNVNNRVEVFAP